MSLSRQVCECADFSHRGAPCKHLLAAEIVSAKSAVCARRYLGGTASCELRPEGVLRSL